MRVRAGLTSAIYAKALVLSNEHEQSTGDIVNLMSVDTTRLQDFCTYGFIAISGPLQVSCQMPYRRKGKLVLNVHVDVDRASFRFAVSSPWMVRVCGGGDHDLQCTCASTYCEVSEEAAGGADEEQG